MIFAPQNLRTLPSDVSLDLRGDAALTLILVKATGEVTFGNTVRNKDTIVEQFDDQADLLMLAWTGRHKTDVFRVERSELAAHYRSAEP